VPLTALEMSRKSAVTGEDFLLCTICLSEAGLLIVAAENPLAETDGADGSDYQSLLDDFDAN